MSEPVLAASLRHAIDWLEAEVAHPREEPHPAMARLASDLRATLAVFPADAMVVGRIIDEHYRFRRDADPKGLPLHECGSFCGADIAARLAAVR